MTAPQTCPCSSGQAYNDCCAPFHRHESLPQTAEQLMRSRYSAYVLHNITYIVETTVPSQQHQLDQADMLAWSQTTHWQGLEVMQHATVGKQHAQVEFKAYFQDGQETACHHELSAFVKIDNRWYFIDPTTLLPGMKHDCICGSHKKFKACCGRFFK